MAKSGSTSTKTRSKVPMQGEVFVPPLFQLEELISDAKIAAEIVWHLASNMNIDHVPVPRLSEEDANTLMTAIGSMRVANRVLDRTFHYHWNTLVAGQRGETDEPSMGVVQ